MGVMYRQHDAPLTAEQRAQRELERARRVQVEREAAEQDRQNRALLASYSNVGDIDAKRARTIEEAGKNLQAAQARLDAAQLHSQELAREAEFYEKRPMPDALKRSLREHNAELATLRTEIEVRKKEITDIEARFDLEKQRYLNLTAKKGAASEAQPTSGASATEKNH